MNILIEKNIMVPMHDGVQLATDVYRPAGDGRYPVIIQRLPYNKDLPAITMLLFDIFRLVQQGYAMLIQDTRGRFASEGEFHPFFQEPADGIDTIAWAASAPWSNGKVGLAGGSYFGATQWLAARETPEALLATVPVITSADYYESWTYQGGAFQLGFILMWTLGFALGEQQRRLKTGQTTMEDLGKTLQAYGNMPALYSRLPLLDMPVLQEVAPPPRSLKPGTVSGWRSPAPTSRASIATPTQEERFRRKRKRTSCRRSTASITTVRTPRI